MIKFAKVKLNPVNQDSINYFKSNQVADIMEKIGVDCETNGIKYSIMGSLETGCYVPMTESMAEIIDQVKDRFVVAPVFINGVMRGMIEELELVEDEQTEILAASTEYEYTVILNDNIAN